MVIWAYGLWFMLMVLYWKVKHLVETFIVFHKNLCKCISFFFSFFFFFLLLTVSGQTSKGFLSNFCQLLLCTCATSTGHTSLDTQTNYCVFALSFCVYEHGMPCALKIHSNGRFKQEHVKSCLSITKIIISLLPKCLWPPNLAGW